MPDTTTSIRPTFANSRRRDVNRMLAVKNTHVWLGAVTVSANLASMIVTPPILLIWNSSSSVPRGLYWVEHSGKIRRGDFVVARMPPQARQLANERNYIPATVPLIKKVAGLAGDRACANGPILRVGRRLVVHRLRKDPSGRNLPWWNECRRLSAHEVVLIGSSRLSFDARYFGPTGFDQIEGRAVPLWTRL